MARGKAWTRDELLLAMNLYCKLPFGQLRHGNPLIISVAGKLDRTPSSLSMKLCNLASLDPHHPARGVQGLKGASRADRAIWEEFNADWERLGVASEEQLQKLLGPTDEYEPAAELPDSKLPCHSVAKRPTAAPTGPTETVMTAKVRLGQRFFRQEGVKKFV